MEPCRSGSHRARRCHRRRVRCECERGRKLEGGNTGITPTNDDELLFNDNVFSTSGASWSADLAGLAAGEYEVYLYAPSHGAVPSGDMSVGGTAVPSIPGDTGSTLIEGTSWLRVPATVTAGSLAITGASTGLAGLAGLQVVFLPEPGQLRQGVLDWQGIGTLAPGCHADIAILDRDPLFCELDALPGTRVLRTILGGQTVFDAGELD